MEQLQAVLPNGGVVFSRLGASGEADLFYYNPGAGLAEIGLDVSALASDSWNRLLSCGEFFGHGTDINSQLMGNVMLVDCRSEQEL